MDGDDYLGHRGHADDVGADAAQKAIFGAGLEVRPRHSDEDTLVADDSLFQGHSLGQGDKVAVVRPAHIGKARPKALVIRMRHVPFIDSTGLNVLRDLVRRTQAEGTMVVIAELQEQPLNAFRRSGLLELLGPDRVVGSLDLALAVTTVRPDA